MGNFDERQWGISVSAVNSRSREERHREVVAQQLGEFPPALRRCTCATASFNRDDHAGTCRLGTTPPLSTDAAPAATWDLPELRF
ncbi:hypothetical protein I546_4158 [Mycobacterium kansasii 732]|nr:hypothetical protein I546_4158 [Mycobacterium kansasii 732]